MDGLLHLVFGRSPPNPSWLYQNVTAHPSTVSVPITLLLYNGALLCGFNVPIKGLMSVLCLCVCVGRPRSTPDYDMETGSSLSVGEHHLSSFSCSSNTDDKS